MNTRRAAALGIAALLVSTVLGALAVQAVSDGRGPAPVLPTTESGALPHFTLANAQAAAWDADAVLVRVGATEGPQVDGRIDPPFLWDTSGDPVHGNGAAVVWTFAYWAPERSDASYWVAVGGDGSLLYARELPNPYFCCVDYVAAAEPVPAHHGETVAASSVPAMPAPRAVSATIDAPAALASVLDDPAFVNFSLDHPVYMAHLELVPNWENDHSVWLIGYRTATYYGAGAAVDAHTGEVLGVGAWPRYAPCCDPIVVPPPPPPEPCCRPADLHETYQGSLGDSYDIGFPIEQAGWLQELTVTATVQDEELPLDDGYVLDLIDSNGRILAREHGSGASTIGITLNAVPTTGLYSVHLKRPETQPIYLPATDLLRGDTPVEIVVDVLYADAPQPRPMTWTYMGEVWTNSENWLSLYAEDTNWRPLRAQSLLLMIDIPQPGMEIELAVVDNWGNDVASTTTGPLASGTWTLTLDVPNAGYDCCYIAAIRSYTPVGIGIGTQTLPYALEVTMAPWEAEEQPQPYH